MRALGLVLLTAGFSGMAPAQTTVLLQPLSLHAALRAAQERSYALLAQDAAARSAHERALAAERLPDPMLRLSVDNLPADGPKQFSLTDDFMTMRSVGLAQTFTRSDKRRARAARFEREADAAQAARTMQLADLRRSTAIAWFDRYYQERMVDLLTRQRDEAMLQIDAAEATYRAGRGPQTDLFMARSNVARIEERIKAAQARQLSATVTLARWVGDLAQSPLGDAPPITTTHLTAHTLDQQIDRHPDIALLASKEAMTLAEVEVARQEKRADWSVELMYSQRGPAFSNMVSFGVRVPLQWNQKNLQDRELNARLAKAEQMRAEREEMTREHQAETQRWFAVWRGNLARIDDYATTLIPLAMERTVAALAAYRGGRGALVGVLEARRMEIDTRIEQVRIEMETAGLWAALEFLIPNAADTGNPSSAPPSAMPQALETQQ